MTIETVQKVGMKNMENKSTCWQLLWTAGLAMGLFLILCAVRGLFPLGDGSILMIDLHSQYTPLLYRFYDVVTGEKNLFMDFSVSGGANLYADTINEVINPFNYLLLFFGRERIYLAINVLLGAYVTAAAVSLHYFLLKIWPDEKQWNLVFSLVYGFSGFAAYQYQIIKWMIFPVLFPLFVLALLRLIREKKGGWYLLLLSYQLMLNLQLGAMTLFAVLFGSGLYFYFCVKKEERKQAMCRLATYTVLGLAASAAVLWPGVFYLLKSARGGENSSYFAVMKQHGLDDLFERLFLTLHPVLLGMFLGFLVLGITGWKKGHVRWKQIEEEGKFLILWNAFLFLTVLAQPSNLLWHLGSYMCFPVRYAYIVLLASISLLKWLQIKREEYLETEGRGRVLHAWQLGCELVSWLFAAAAMYLTLQEADQITQAFSTLAISRVCPSQTLLVGVIMIILTAAALLALLAGKRKRDSMTIVACISGLCLFFFILLPQDYAVRLMNEDAYKTMNAMYRELTNEKAGQTADTGSFSRVSDDEDLPLNAALITGENTLTGYFPAGSQMVYAKGLEQLGYLTPWVSTRSWGGTMVSDAVLGVEKNETILRFRSAIILEDGAEALEKGTQAAAQEGTLALQAFIGKTVAGQDVLTCADGVKLYKEESGCLQFYVKGQQAVYLDAGVSADQISVQVNGKEVRIPEAGLSECPHRLLYLGSYSNCELEIRVLYPNGEAVPADSMKLGFLNLDVWKEAAQKVRTAEITADRRLGSMQINLGGLDAGQTLFVPVAAIDGWKCSADGEKVDIIPVFGGFMGITIPDQAQKLEFTFTPPGFIAGSCVSAAAVLGFLLLLLAAKRSVEFPKVTAFLAVCYQAVWCAGVLLIYIVPNIGMVCYMVYRILAG